MIVTIFLDLIVGNNLFQSIFGSIDHNSMIVTTRIFNLIMILELINRSGLANLYSAYRIL